MFNQLIASAINNVILNNEPLVHWKKKKNSTIKLCPTRISVFFSFFFEVQYIAFVPH
jgi:hypothetical protein